MSKSYINYKLLIVFLELIYFYIKLLIFIINYYFQHIFNYDLFNTLNYHN